MPAQSSAEKTVSHFLYFFKLWSDFFYSLDFSLENLAQHSAEELFPKLDFGLAEVDSSGNLLRSSAAPSQPDFPELDFSSSGEILQPQVPQPPQDFPELDFSLPKVSSSGELLRSAAPSPPLFHLLDFSLAQLPDTPKANFHDSVSLLDFSLPLGNIISSRSSVRSAEKSAEKFE